MTYSIKNWIDDRQKRGKMVFTYEEIKEHFSENSEPSVRLALTRLTCKTEIISVWKGFYVIIPMNYALRGNVPPEFYIDFLMKYLERNYYVALLDAGVFYGAAHQKPQQFSVICEFPSLRDLNKKGIHIHFKNTRKQIPQNRLNQFKTETGFVKVSSPELTAADLITFQKEIGGLNRACTVLCELAESLNFNTLDKSFFDYVPAFTIQRLGYLLEYELDQPRLADCLYQKAKDFACIFQKIPLKYGKTADDCEYNQKWKIIVNEKIETDQW